MHIEQRRSGLLVAREKRLKPKPPPEHPARAKLRLGLQAVADSLKGEPLTTHGTLYAKPVTIEYVCENLVKAYNEPDAYHFSNLSQAIRKFCEVANQSD